MKLFDETDRGFVPQGFTPDLHGYDLILLNTSGGKDSQACMDYVVSLTDEAGIPRERLVALHADLKEMEWPKTAPTVTRHAEAYGLRLVTVSRAKGDLLDHVEERGLWPAATTRYCTSAHKREPSAKELTKLANEVNARRMIPRGKLLKRLGLRPARILNVFGFRAQESGARNKKLVFERDVKLSSGNRTVDVWLPIHDWSETDVWSRIHASGIPAHSIYASKMSRASCSFCVLSSKADLVTAARLRPDLAHRYADLERRIGHRFQNNLSIAEILRLAEDGE